MAKTDQRKRDFEQRNGARRKAFAYMDGWRAGASLLPISEEQSADPDFNEGWKAGREAKEAAKRVAETKYGYRFAVLKLC